MEKSKVRDWDRLVVRVPEGVRDELEQMAADNCRPLNGEMLLMIKNALAARKAASAVTAS